MRVVTITLEQISKTVMWELAKGGGGLLHVKEGTILVAR
jgi:hypothetical protein